MLFEMQDFILMAIKEEKEVQNGIFVLWGWIFSSEKEMGFAGAQPIVGSPCSPGCAVKGVGLTKDSGKLPQKPKPVCFAWSLRNKPSVICTKQ